MTDETTNKHWVLCPLCNGVAHDPEPPHDPCDNCAGHGGKWFDENGEIVSND